MKSSFVSFYKKSIFFASFSALALSTAANAADAFRSLAQEILAPVEKVFVPQNFDSNDNAEIVISGSFPDSCHKMGKVTHKHLDDKKTIVVEVTAYRIQSDFCLTINIPYIQVLPLGTLDAAKYSIVVNKTVKSQIPIAQGKLDGNGDRDDFTYGSVYGLIQKGPRQFQMQGVSPNRCYKIVEVKVNPETSDVVVVQPIMKKDESCDEASDTRAVTWIEDFDVPEEISGKTLIHVRTLHGGSINQVVDLK